VNPDTGLVEIVEIEDHPFSLVCNTIQNIKVRLQTHIYFVNFVAAAVKAKEIISVHQKIEI
jgi:CTP synthase